MRKFAVTGLVAVPVLAVAAGGIAWAAWGVRGSGASKVKAETAVPLVVLSATTSPGTALYPGGTADLVVRVRNDNRFPVTIGSVIRTSKPITTDPMHSGCSGTLLDTTRDDDTFVVDVRLAAAEDRTFTVPGAIRMDPAAGNACQGARFGIPVTVSGVSG